MRKKQALSLLISGVIILTFCACKTMQNTKNITWKPLNEPGCGGFMTGLIVSPHDSNRILLPGDMLGLGISTDQGKTWQSTFGFKSWELADATWHPTNPDIVWLGSMSGPYKSTDGGINWQEKRNGFPKYGPYYYSAPIEKVLFDPANHSRLLAFGGSSRQWKSPGTPKWGAVWESSDGGENWKKLTTITPSGSSTSADAKGLNILSVSYLGNSKNKLIASVLKHGIYLSHDNGTTWLKSNTGLPHMNTERIAVHPKNQNIAWVGLNNVKNKKTGTYIPGGVYKSLDGGKTWQNSSVGLSQKAGKSTNYTANYKGLAVSTTNPDILYVSDKAWDTGIVYRSKDGGNSWRAVATKNNFGRKPSASNIFNVKTAYPPGLGMTTLTIDPSDENIVYGLGTEYVIQSKDGGKTWQDLTSTQIDPQINSWIGHGYSGLCSMNFTFSPIDPKHWILQAMDAGKLWQTFDGGKSWIRYIDKPHPWGGSRDLAFAGNHHIYASLGQHREFMGIGKSIDNGKTWEILGGKEIGLPDFGHSHAPNGIYAVAAQPDKIWLTHRGNLYYSDNAGKSWKIINKTTTFKWFAGDPKKPIHFFVSSKNGVYETHDGLSFTNIGGPKAANKMVVNNSGVLYVVSHRAKNRKGGLWQYHNKKWQQILADNHAYSVAIDPVDNNRLAVTTSDNPYHDDSQAKSLWLSDDGGKTWSNQTNGLAVTRGTTIKFNPHDHEMLVFGSLGRGFFTCRWPDGLQLTNRVAFDEQTGKMAIKTQCK